MLNHMRNFWRSDRGATAIEYGMIASLIFLAIVGSIGALGKGVSDALYNKLVAAFG